MAETGLYDATLDGAPVLALTGQTYHDVMGTSYQQEVDLLSLFRELLQRDGVGEMVSGAGQVTSLVDIASRDVVGCDPERAAQEPLSLGPIAPEKTRRVVQERRLPDQGIRVRGRELERAVDLPPQAAERDETHEARPVEPHALPEVAEEREVRRRIVLLDGDGRLGSGDAPLAIAARRQSGARERRSTPSENRTDRQWPATRLARRSRTRSA